MVGHKNDDNLRLFSKVRRMINIIYQISEQIVNIFCPGLDNNKLMSVVMKKLLTPIKIYNISIILEEK